VATVTGPAVDEDDPEILDLEPDPEPESPEPDPHPQPPEITDHEARVLRDVRGGTSPASSDDLLVASELVDLGILVQDGAGRWRLTELGAAALASAEADADPARARDRRGGLIVLADAVAAYLAGHAGASVGDVVRHVHELCPARPGLHDRILRAIDSYALRPRE